VSKSAIAAESTSTHKRDDFDLVVSCESCVDMFRSGNNLAIEFHGQEFRIHLKSCQQVGHGRIGFNLLNLTVHKHWNHNGGKQLSKKKKPGISTIPGRKLIIKS
jgi:hypothetical protein